MNVFSVLTMLGGLAMFLFGMNVMGSGLEKLSGGKLERILERLTNNPLKGVLFGAAVTAVIQSSSAVTVMVVGFVNSGIMQLYQAVGIIMGANVGTTITSWLLSLTGIEGNSFFLQMLKPTSFSPILALIGVVLIMGKTQKKKDIGNILLGFAVLMFGMSTMSDAVKPLADVPEFTSILTRFSNPLLGLLTGALLTAVIQSSSASVGILQALSVTGVISYQMAIPIILGQNIGTCVTALISSIGTNTNAKRTSMVHLYFNIIGAGVFMGLFLLAKAVFKMDFLSDAIGVAGIAVVHTIFNMVSTLALLPFGKLLEKLAVLTVRGKKSGIPSQSEALQPNVGELIEDRFLFSPAYALEKCRDMTMDMADTARQNVLLAMEFIHKYDEALKGEIDRNEEKIDAYEDNLETYLMKISAMELAPGDSREMSKLHHAIGNFERIGDYSINLLKTKKIMHKKKTSFSKIAKEELKVMEEAVKEILELSLIAYKETDVEMAQRVEPLEQVIDGLKDELRVRHITRFESGECSIEQGFAFLDIISSFERISDHCSNIAVSIIELSRNSYQTHEYLSMVKANNGRFREYYNDYLFKYTLN